MLYGALYRDCIPLFLTNHQLDKEYSIWGYMRSIPAFLEIPVSVPVLILRGYVAVRPN